jgi:hypothetical protein
MSKTENPSFLGSMILTVASGLSLVASFSSAKPNPLLITSEVLALLLGIALAVRSAYLATEPEETSGSANGQAH